ncbi:DEAD/DEAH box helicase [Vibrio fluvialis]
MYDSITSQLIQSTPALPGLDRESLPDYLSKAYAEIVSSRVLLRNGEANIDDLIETVKFSLRLARTNEALVSISPEREDKKSASFVAATAYQLAYQATVLRHSNIAYSYINLKSISPDVSAMLLFLIAEAFADASEISRIIKLPEDDLLQRELIWHLIMLSQGNVAKITARRRPSKKKLVIGEGGQLASNALYYRMLRGVRALAFTLQGRSIRGMADPIEVFSEVKELASSTVDISFQTETFKSQELFPGPFHLASLLIATGNALLDSAVVKIPPPNRVDRGLWLDAMKALARTRPYLWKNHKDAIERGYLNSGVSAAIGFPTGSGKSTTAQLKLHATLLRGCKAVFLAPTHALVDQTARDLNKIFPRAGVKRERADDFSLLDSGNDLPDIMVMTPEACLLATHLDPERFVDVGVFIFDECHLIHPKSSEDRRAIDAMLCILGFVRVAPDADIVLMSAMMKNTKELSDWLSELTNRLSISLDNSWKPTRQLRGCIVYDSNRLSILEKLLSNERAKKTQGSVPAKLKRQLTATPLAFFSVKQTWASMDRRDYAKVPFSSKSLELSTNARWGLTPNSGVVASSIAAEAAKAGIRTLVFSQSIPNAVSIAEKASTKIPPCSLDLTGDEKKAYEIAVDEIGSPEKLYIKLSNGKLVNRAGCHHGQLLPEERFLAESLYKREGALAVLAATPTLGQGMNLPADLVIIAEDSQFNMASGSRDILKPEDLLNSAGRAGRAGESATGIVLVIPGKVVGLNDQERTIGNRWTTLREIFGQSDQCIILDDPLTSIMDRIHNQVEEVGDLERYVVARLAETEKDEEGKSEVTHGLRRSFAAFRQKQKGNTEWIVSRTAAARSILDNNDVDSSEESQALRDLASMLGMPEDVLKELVDSLVSDDFTSFETVDRFVKWMFDWLSRHPHSMYRLLKPENFESLFDNSYNSLQDDVKKAKFAIPLISSGLSLWMQGETLIEIQKVFSSKTRDLKYTTSARKFVIRMVPDLAHLMSVPLQVLLRYVNDGTTNLSDASPALNYASLAVRRGLNSAEMVAYAVQKEGKSLSRRELHRGFLKIQPYLGNAGVGEKLIELESRVKHAMLQENTSWD